MRLLDKKNIFTFLFFALFQTFALGNNPEIAKKSIFEVLNTPEVQEITIQANISTIIRNKRSKEYETGNLIYKDDQGLEKSYSIKLRARGKYRRRVCDFPPLKIKFSKKALEKEDLKPFNKLKLVTHCKDTDLNEQTLLKEYQTYRLFNLLTEKSFKVKLLKVNYIDIDGTKTERYGFFIESEEELAERLNGSLFEGFNTPDDSLNADQKNLLAVFQFMIGNSDWHVQRLKNVALIQPSESKGLIPVPYDFDFAGLVDAPYAIPSQDFPINSVKERIFLGPEINELQMEPIRLQLESMKEALLACCDDFNQLDKGERKEMTRYLLSFYKIIDQREKWTSL